MYGWSEPSTRFSCWSGRELLPRFKPFGYQTSRTTLQRTCLPTSVLWTSFIVRRDWDFFQEWTTCCILGTMQHLHSHVGWRPAGNVFTRKTYLKCIRIAMQSITFASKYNLGYCNYFHNSFVHIWPNTFFLCRYCYRSFLSRKLLEDHQDSVHPILKCGICDWETRRPRFEFDKHVATHKNSYLCRTCGKTFRWQSNLAQHQLTHQEKKYKCKVCGKGFARNDKLTIHMRTHTGEKPYTCPVCGYSATIPVRYFSFND